MRREAQGWLLDRHYPYWSPVSRSEYLSLLPGWLSVELVCFRLISRFEGPPLLPENYEPSESCLAGWLLQSTDLYRGPGQDRGRLYQDTSLQGFRTARR